LLTPRDGILVGILYAVLRTLRGPVSEYVRLPALFPLPSPPPPDPFDTIPTKRSSSRILRQAVPLEYEYLPLDTHRLNEGFGYLMHSWHASSALERRRYGSQVATQRDAAGTAYNSTPRQREAARKRVWANLGGRDGKRVGERTVSRYNNVAALGGMGGGRRPGSRRNKKKLAWTNKITTDHPPRFASERIGVNGDYAPRHSFEKGHVRVVRGSQTGGPAVGGTKKKKTSRIKR
jgi:hypothetical protein